MAASRQLAKILKVSQTLRPLFNRRIVQEIKSIEAGAKATLNLAFWLT